MSLGKLVLDLELNGNQFTISLNQATGALGQFVMGAKRADSAVRKAESSTRSWGLILRDTVVGLALARDAVRTLSDVTLGWQKAIIGANSEMEKSIALMKNFSKQRDPMVATQEAVADVNKLLARASTSPFSLTAITDAFVKLRVGGVDPAEKSLNTLVDSVAAFGGSGENLKRAGVALQQMAGKGVVSMEELRQQLGESVPTAINAMADALGTSYSKLVKEISQGKVLSKPAVLAMMQELERSFAGSAANMMNTWGGAVAQFETGVKKLAVAFGGLSEDGFAQDGYLKIVTNELKSLNDVLTDPEMLASAKELGMTVAGFVTTLADGTKWIIAHREQIVEWGKALLMLWAAYKGVSIIQGVMATAGAATQALAMKMITMRMQGLSMGSAMATAAGQMSGWNNAAAVAAGGAVRIATGSAAAGTAVRMMGGALGIIAGPIGLVAGLAVTGAMAWMDYKKGVREAEQAVLGLNGALTNNAQLMTLDDVRKRKRAEFEDKFGKGANVSIGMQGDYANVGDYKKAKQAALEQLNKLDEDFLKARLNVAKANAATDAGRQIAANSAALGEISRKYVIDKEGLRKQFEQEAKKDKKAFDQEGFASALIQRQRIRIDDEIQLYEEGMQKAQKTIDTLMPNGQKAVMSQEQLQEFEAAKVVIAEYQTKVSDAKDALQTLGQVQLPDTLVNGPGGKPTKAAFDAMTIFVDGLRKKLATLDAKLEETNPYLAQLEATVESLGGKKLPNFDKVYADGVKMAEAMWAQEKARKAIVEANNLYKESIERIGQIETVAKNKLNKAEETNPWEKASADAIRYEEELDDLILKMEEARKKAADAQVDGGGKGLLKKLDEEAVVAAARVDDVRKALEKLKVSDTAKRMKEDTLSINDALLSESGRVEAQYDRQTRWADEFYRKHQEQLNTDAEAMASYNEYRTALDDQYARETESGLDEWIRANKDATEEYKSLWGSAMNQFTDTLTEGLTTGKFEFGDFVKYVLKEIIRIQTAKAMAAAAEAVGGGWMKTLGGLAMSIGMAYFGASAGGALSSAATSGAATGATNVSNGMGMDLGNVGVNFPNQFANGGIMTEYGQLALKKYANGGIAKTPQVAIYGEGKKPEAYVPLPDGRTIPVTMDGGGGEMNSSESNVAININVNQDGSSGSSSEGNNANVWKSMAQKVKQVALDEIAAQKRPGGILYQ